MPLWTPAPQKRDSGAKSLILTLLDAAVERALTIIVNTAESKAPRR